MLWSCRARLTAIMEIGVGAGTVDGGWGKSGWGKVGRVRFHPSPCLSTRAGREGLRGSFELPHEPIIAPS